MIYRDAHAAMGRVLAPMPVEKFLDEIAGKRFIKIPAVPAMGGQGVLGPDPERLILDSFAALAPKMGCHAAAPLGPYPAIEAVADAEAFRAKIAAFHDLAYTARITKLRGVSPALDEFLRALEFFFHVKADVEAFWSRGDANAPLHFDDYDLIAIQLKGRKRWFISGEPSPLPNAWKTGPDNPPPPDRFQNVLVEPGDLLYLPHGTHHWVEGLGEPSIHASIGFLPLTLRDAMIAAIDHLSDMDKALRETVGSRIAYAVRGNDFKSLPARLREGLAKLGAVCASDEFVAQAMQRRSSRAIGELEKSGAPKAQIVLSPSTRLRHTDGAMAHLLASPERIDFAYPGGHIYIHRGVEQAVAFIAETPEFSAGELPGALPQDVRLALVQKFIDSGFLVAADG